MTDTIKKKVLLIGNPIAGRGKSERVVRQFVQAQEQRGYAIETFLTRSAGDANRRVRHVEPDVGTLVVAGGDGTLNEVLNGLPDPTQIPIALLPLGTANILAHELALPNKPEAVSKVVAEGHVRWLDMGLAGDHRFLMLVSAGLDAMVTEEVRRTRGKRLGYWGYALPILKGFVRYRVPDLRVTVDERGSFRGAFVVVSNTKIYGGFLSFADRACCDSGHLDVCIFPKGSLLALSRYYFAALYGSVSKGTDVTYLTGRRVLIESREPVAVEIDGDFFGTTPVHIDLVPSSVPIIVPRRPHSNRR